MSIKRKTKISIFEIVAAILILDIAFFTYSCNKSAKTKLSGRYKQVAKPYKMVSNQAFVGAKTCKKCHAEAYKKWKESDHYHAMAVADSKNVRGDFNNTTFRHNGTTYRFFKKNGSFMVHTKGPKGRCHNYNIAYTLGWTPLQQYLIRFPGGKYQALTVAWNTKKKQWFSLYPNLKINPHDFLYWTRGAMNWNTMCANCHSTNLHQNYIAKSDSFHTTWSSINVSCEACHGPGKKHVDYIRSLHGKKPDMKIVRSELKMTTGIGSHKLAEECARCHSLREQVSKAYNFKGTLMDHFVPDLPHPPNYYPDGQIKNEDYVYGSFLQSRMYHAGIACTNCHNPHTYHLIAKGNALCISCHASSYNTPAHTHHKMNTAGAKCVNCHMTGKNYMQVDFRRDHSFRIPRPDLTEKYGTPNACNSCHKKKSAKWAAQTIQKWYGSPTPKNHFYKFTEVLAQASKTGPNAEPELIRLAKDNTQPAIARATALWYLGQFSDGQAVNAMQQALKSKSSLVRTSAVKAVSNLSESARDQILKPMIMDSVRSVRVAAMSGLANLQKSDFPDSEQSAYKVAYRDLKQHFQVTQYFPAGQFNQGEYYERMKKWGKAEKAYRKALAKNPHFNEARINLADLYNQQGKNNKAEKLLKTVVRQEPDYGPAYYSLALLVAQKGRLNVSIGYFKEAVKRMPEHARIYYNWAIVYQKLHQYHNSEQKYLKAIHIDPNNTDYQYGIITLYLQNKKLKMALQHAKKLVEMHPDNQRFRILMERIENNIR
ncbi:MAG TPA: tetratricopeptide repeat protein [Balneolales bacterium]|nr:tetratricopeptide repeat protein [Balneolales bacterium]